MIIPMILFGAPYTICKMLDNVGSFNYFKHEACKTAGCIHVINLLASDMFSQCHADLLKCTEQNVNNQSLTI